MKNSDINDPLFLQAVEAIDAGDIAKLEVLLAKHPSLVRERLDYPEGYYFKDPYLLWFVADNPIRVGKLAPNIVNIARLLITHVKREAGDNIQYQLDYALGLVATGRIPRECGVQIALIDLLIDEGAKPGGGTGALAHGNIDAAKRLIERGGKLSLAVAVGLDMTDDVMHLAATTSRSELVHALTLAAFYGKAAMVSYLLGMGANPNDYPARDSGFHTHATPLHQAIYSRSMETVKLLVDAGARLDLTDKVYNGTPLGWAIYMQTEEGYDEAAKRNFAKIEEYLRGLKSDI